MKSTSKLNEKRSALLNILRAINSLIYSRTWVGLGFGLQSFLDLARQFGKILISKKFDKFSSSSSLAVFTLNIKTSDQAKRTKLADSEPKSWNVELGTEKPELGTFQFVRSKFCVPTFVFPRILARVSRLSHIPLGDYICSDIELLLPLGEIFVIRL